MSATWWHDCELINYVSAVLGFNYKQDYDTGTHVQKCNGVTFPQFPLHKHALCNHNLELYFIVTITAWNN